MPCSRWWRSCLRPSLPRRSAPDAFATVVLRLQHHPRLNTAVVPEGTEARDAACLSESDGVLGFGWTPRFDNENSDRQVGSRGFRGHRRAWSAAVAPRLSTWGRVEISANVTLRAIETSHRLRLTVVGMTRSPCRNVLGSLTLERASMCYQAGPNESGGLRARAYAPTRRMLSPCLHEPHLYS